MLKISRVVIISILIVTQLSVWAQNNTNSPYTRFGYGEIADRSFGAGRAMGGLGIGLRSGKQVNPMNPASYTAIDSMTFIFDMGIHAQRSWYSDGGGNNQSNYNGNLEYLAMLFPVHKRIAVSAGVLPYSFVGYQFGELKEVGDLSYSEAFVGSGGLNEVYAGLSIDIWKKRLSVGANVGYLFGKIDHERNVEFYDNTYRNIVNLQRIKVNDVKFDFGLQYTHPLSATQQVVVGAVYSPAKQLNTTSYDILQVGSTSSGGSLVSDTTTNQRFDIPDAYGIGFSYTKNNKLTVGVDIKYENWSAAYYFDKNDSFDNRLRVALGAEFIPNFYERNILMRSRYRAGIHYSNSYRQALMDEGNSSKRYGFKEYGASVGLGIPIRTGYPYDENRSLINISIEYVKVKPEIRAMVTEQYLRVTLNLTFNEMWFLKRKI